MRTLPAIFAAALALCGCSDDFAPYSRLDRLRILAMQGEPATPLPGDTATLSALTFAPAGETPTLHWTWCPVSAPAGDDYACPIGQAEAQQAFAGALDVSANSTLPSLDLGTAATSAFTNPFSLSALATLCAAGLDAPAYAQSFDCEGGFPVTVVLDASTASASLRAGFVLRLPVGISPELNHNPLPSGLHLAGVALADPPAAITVPPAQSVDLRVDVPALAIETRSIPLSEGPPGQRLERLTVSWFADSGTIDKSRTSFIDGLATLEQASLNRFTSPTLANWPASNLAFFAVVVRDDRGGVGWLVQQAILEPGP